MTDKESFTDNKQSIFEKCPDDIEIFLEKHSQSKDLTLEEVKAIDALCNTTIKFGFGDEVVLGIGESSGLDCIFKLTEDLWIVWTADDRRGFCQAEQFDNVTNACIAVLRRAAESDSIDSVIAYFNSILNQDTPITYLNNFANEMRYTVVPSEDMTLKREPNIQSDKNI